MNKLSSLYYQHVNPKNIRLLTILLTLAALAVAAGAPSAGSGMGSG